MSYNHFPINHAILPMTPAQRREFIRKVKADALAYRAAELLKSGKSSEAASEIERGAAIVGREQFAFWLQHYAVKSLGVDRKLVGAVLDSCEGVAA